MELSNLLSQGSLQPGIGGFPADDLATTTNSQDTQHYRQYPTRQAMASYQHNGSDSRFTTPPVAQAQTASPSGHTPYNMSPTSPTPKHVSFELLLPESPDRRARLPMRVQIFPHDTTDSIITTVKNFYGLYEGPGGAKGVSFEDDQGNTLIARYENLRNNMIVYVRVIPDHSSPINSYSLPAYRSGSAFEHRKGSGSEGMYSMPPPQPAQFLNYGQPPSRPASRAARNRSTSPQPGRGRRSTSTNTNRGRNKKAKSRGSSAHDSAQDLNSDAANGYLSDSDGGNGSVTSSRQAKAEQLASADISLDNIVEGGRRKRAKFESSELPLFVPPQVPITTSTSSVSPQRRINGININSPYSQPGHRTFGTYNTLPSPQSFGNTEGVNGYQTFQYNSSYSTPSTQPTHRYPSRTNNLNMNGQSSGGSAPAGTGVLPTPDPTVASCISDEDVALQLMRLGDMSNISAATRNSTSTLDDALSGKAEVASSTGATSESEDEGENEALPAPKIDSSPFLPTGSIKKRHKHLDEILPSVDSTESGDEATRGYEEDQDYEDGLKDEGDEEGNEEYLDEHRAKFQKLKHSSSGKPRSSNKGKLQKSRTQISSKVRPKAPKIPITPAPSVQPHSRKVSTSSTINFQHQFGEDEEDLSSKPRCQRCRKSKKGCDRQRPCQRCKDAGIGIDGCISEDEGNGRKGRYGRHMGVPVKKNASALGPAPDSTLLASTDSSMINGVQSSPDKSKKRKR